MKILLIEDNAGCRLSVEAYLLSVSKEPLEFIYSETLLEGLRAARNADIVVLDLCLPDSQNPAETVKAYTPLLREIPTIIVSGSDELPCVMEAIDNGAKSFICKPKLEGMSEAFSEIVKALHAKQGT